MQSWWWTRSFFNEWHLVLWLCTTAIPSLQFAQQELDVIVFSRLTTILLCLRPHTNDSFIFIDSHCVADLIAIWIWCSTLQECVGIFVFESQFKKPVSTINLDKVFYVDASDNSSSWFDQVLRHWWFTPWIGFQTISEKEIKLVAGFIKYDSSDLEFIHLFGGERFKFILTWALDTGIQRIHVGVQCGIDPSLSFEIE